MASWHIYNDVGPARPHLFQLGGGHNVDHVKAILDRDRPRQALRLWHDGTGEEWRRRGGVWQCLHAAQNTVGDSLA